MNLNSLAPRIAAALLLLLAAVPPALAQHSRFRSGVTVYVGPPVWDPYYPPPPYYYYPRYPRVVAVPVAPPVYVEQSPVYVEQAPVGTGAPLPPAPAAAAAAPPSTAAAAYWHYCDSPQGYYPYVKECPGGWQRVEPQPPPRR